MASNLDQLFEARRQLVAAASHDLRTPIAAIEAMHEAIEDGLVDVDYYLPALREQARALRVLVDGLFELARIDAGSLTTRFQAHSLVQVVEVCLRAVEVEAVTRDVATHRFRSKDASGLLRPDQIRRVVTNLLTNALRFTPAGGFYRRPHGSNGFKTRIVVEDDGSGLSARRGANVRALWRDDLARLARIQDLGLT